MAASVHNRPTSQAEEHRLGRRVTWVGAVVNAALIGLKFAAGILGHSQAMIADAVHSFSDFVTDAIVLVGLWAGRKEPDEAHHFGHARIETIATALVGVALIGVAVFLAYGAGSDIYHHVEQNPTWPALAAAALSIVSKEWLYQYTVRVARRIKSSAVVANAWHHRSDALSSVAVLFGVLAALINPAWHMMDAYAALLVSFMILVVGVQVLWQALLEVVDTAPGPEVIERMKRCVEGVEGVLGYHDLKVRSSGKILQMQVHVVVDGSLTVTVGHRIAKAVEDCLFEQIEDLGEVIVHIDPDAH